MKPLTIEELKALEVGDWVYIVILDADSVEESFPKQTYFQKSYSEIGEKHFPFMLDGFEDGLDYEFYGIDWLAYKNKEQAEAKGEILELPCINKPINLGMPIFEVIYRNKYNSIMRETIYEEEKAEARLQELRGEK